MDWKVVLFLLNIVATKTGTNYITDVFDLDETSSQVFLQNAVMDRRTGRIYVGAKNRLYEFDENLEILTEMKTGPELDNVECPIRKYQCEFPKTLTPSYSKAILIDYENNKLIHCISLYQGVCLKHDINNIKDIEEPIYDDAIVANNDSATTFAFIAPGPLDQNGQDTSVINIGVQYTNKGWKRDRVYCFATRKLDDFKLVYKDIVYKSGTMLDWGLRQVFPIRYVYGFGSKGFSYMITVQKQSPSTELYITKIFRVCQQDMYYYSYAEVRLQCWHNGALYNLAQAAYLGKAGIQLAKALNINDTEDVLYASFSISAPRSSEPTQDSALCVYPMRSIRRIFTANIQDCFKGKGNTGPGYFGQAVPCKDTPQLNVDDDYCGEHREVNSPTDGTTPVSQQVAVTFHVTVTSLSIDIVNEYTVAFAGTKNGHIFKIALKTQTFGVIYEDVALAEDHAIKPSLLFDLDHEHIYAITENKIFKIAVQMCSQFTSCENCLGSRDPYCGWCVLEGRCCKRDACMSNSQWISGTNGQCPYMEDVTPVAMSNKNIQQLHLRVSHVLQGVPVSCTFQSDRIGDEFTHTVPATVSDGGKLVTCMPRDVLLADKRIKGYLTVEVSVVTNVSVSPTMKGNFTIYRCETFYRCKHCTASAWKCKWCIRPDNEQPFCIDHDKGCNTDLELKAGECPGIISYTMVPEDASLQDSNGTVYLSRDRNYEIKVKGINLPKPSSVSYKCKVAVLDTNLWFNRTVFNDGRSFTCSIHKEEMSVIPRYADKLEATVEVLLGVTPVDGDAMPVVIYECGNIVKPSYNCGRCKSFAVYQPHFRCKWCKSRCIDSGMSCNTTDSPCGDPEITRVYPLSAHVNATTTVEIEGVNLGVVYGDTVNAVTIAGEPCASIKSLYEPGVRISCKLYPSNRQRSGSVVITFTNNSTGWYSKRFYFWIPVITSIKPTSGPISGGTSVTVYGQQLNIGRYITVTIGDNVCEPVNHMNPTFDLVTRKDQLIQTTTYSPNELICKTGSVDEDKLQDVLVQIDGARVLEEMSITYLYVADPVITDIHPKKSFYSGGITLTVEGSNLNTIQTPMVYAIIDGFKTISENCTKSGETDAIHCPSPRYKNASAVSGWSMVKGKSGSEYVSARLGFEMDGVASVTADNLHSHIATLEFVTDPVLENFTEVKLYQEHQPYLVIKGYRLMHAANKHDVKVIIGCEFCNVTFASNVEILCKPPVDKPACGKSKEEPLDVHVWIGYFHQSVGFFAYETSLVTQSHSTVTNTAGIVTESKLEEEPSNPTNIAVVVLLATAVIAIGSFLAYCKCRTTQRKPSKDVTSVVFRRNQNEEMNERQEDPLNQETTASVSHACARETSNVYDVIHDHDVVNVYLEILGDDPTYTQADEYIDPHPYRKIESTVDQSEIKDDTSLNDSPTRTDLNTTEKYVQPDPTENQEKVDEVETDLDVGYIHPIASLNNENDTFDESKSAGKNEEQIAECGNDVDGGYIHPIGSLPSGTATCNTK